MHEVTWPVAGWLVLAMIVVPVATLLSKGLLLASRRWHHDPSKSGSWVAYGLLVSPVVLPLAWLSSAAIHHAEPGVGARACRWDAVEDVCMEPLGFAAVLALFIVVSGVRRRDVIAGVVAGAPASSNAALRARLDKLGVAGAHLDRIRIVEGYAVRTVGLVRPTIELGVSSAAALDDRALAAALMHEAAHCESHDPLRYLVAVLCETVNPLGRLLAPDLQRWRVAREQACARQAVHRGADPLALAHAILIAARHPRHARGSVGLSNAGTRIQDRVDLLLGYQSAPPACTCSRAGWLATALVASVVLVAPHAFDAWPLHNLHVALETDAHMASP